jgi:DNA repair exonuclease SbcCD ATPase subunit
MTQAVMIPVMHSLRSNYYPDGIILSFIQLRYYRNINSLQNNMADLNFNTLSIRNFLTIGNVTEEIKLDNNLLTLVLGENLDSGGENSRNGVGKSTILKALFFALYGTSIGNIKKDNLVNNINLKHMEVSIEFNKFGKHYKVVRGRKPAFLQFFVEDGLVQDPTNDEAQGESKYTQQEITKIIGMSPELFKQIILMTTDAEQVVAMKATDQKPIIEEMLGITLISTRAEKLKDIMKNTKEEIKEEEILLKGRHDNNTRISKMISDVQAKSIAFEQKKQDSISTIKSSLAVLAQVDIEQELENHDMIVMLSGYKTTLTNQKKYKVQLETNIKSLSSKIDSLCHQLEHAKNKTCHACNQTITTNNNDNIANELELALNDYDAKQSELDVVTADIQELNNALSEAPDIHTVYDNKQDAYQHKHTIVAMKEALVVEENLDNPYTEQIESLTNTGLLDISTIELDQKKMLFQHQEFLYKLLTNKDSFIRKKIIESNISSINRKINQYLDLLNLPHEVTFNNDLTIDIDLMGRDFDFPQLSRGERNRVLLATSWAFRKSWEEHNHSINLMMIDEMLDSGLDNSGAEKALHIMKSFVRDEKKTCFLISHKDELIGRVGNVLLIKKEDGFTSLEYK